MILGALDAAGGQEYLTQQATANPSAFMTLLGKILPTQLTGDGGGPVVIVDKPLEEMTDDELHSLYRAGQGGASKA